MKPDTITLSDKAEAVSAILRELNNIEEQQITVAIQQSALVNEQWTLSRRSVTLNKALEALLNEKQ